MIQLQPGLYQPSTLLTINYFEPHDLSHLIQQFQFGVGDDQIGADAVSSFPTV
jgi:hypothetical protein